MTVIPVLMTLPTSTHHTGWQAPVLGRRAYDFVRQVFANDLGRAPYKQHARIIAPTFGTP